MRTHASRALLGSIAVGVCLGASAGPVFVTELPPPVEDNTALATDGALLIDGLSKKTGKGSTDWQSARILLSGAGTDSGDASGVLSTTNQTLALTRGWASVSVAPMSSESGAAAPGAEAAVWLRPWVFISVGGVGAGAEGTKFLVQLDPGDDAADPGDDIIRIFSDGGNTKHVLVVVSFTTDDGVESAKDVGVYPGKFVTLTLVGGVYHLNGKSIKDISDGAVLGEKPDDHAAFLKQVAAEVARAKF